MLYSNDEIFTTPGPETGWTELLCIPHTLPDDVVNNSPSLIATPDLILARSANASVLVPVKIELPVPLGILTLSNKCLSESFRCSNPLFSTLINPNGSIQFIGSPLTY
ncbi:hypothetical protein A9G42_07445 [Gilliamella sp. Nev6-6]|nr:hypothetical protein A9G42_07445 [Gilliamella apicola]